MAGEESPQISAQAVLRRYRQLLWLAAAPVFALVVLLGVWQAFAQHRRLLDTAASQAQARVVAIESMAQATADHVNDLQGWFHQQLASDARREPDPAVWAALLPREDQAGEPDGLTLDGLPSLLRREVAQFLWIDPSVPPTREVFGRVQDMSALMDRAHLRMPDLAWSYYYGWPQRYVVIYPWVPSRDLAEDLGHPSLRAMVDEWYGFEAFTRGTPVENRARLSYWSSPYVDAETFALSVSHAAPVYHGDDFLGVVGADLRLEPVEALLSGLPGAPWRAWIVDDGGNVLADRAQPVAAGRLQGLGPAPAPVPTPSAASGPAATDQETSASSPERVRGTAPRDIQMSIAALLQAAPDSFPESKRVPSLTDRLPRGIDAIVIARGAEGRGEPLAVAGQELIALRSGVAPWTVVLTAPSGSLWLKVLPLVAPYLLIASALFIVVLASHRALQRRILEPALGVIGYLQRLSSDENAPEPRLGERWRPWVQVVTQTFGRLRESLRREQRSEAFKSSIVDHALAAIVAADAEGRIVEFNPAAEAMFGYRRDEVVGRRVGEVIVPARFRAGAEGGPDLLHDPSTLRLLGRRVERTGMRADGSEFPVEMLLWRVVVDGADFFTASLFDLSERRAAAQEIERQREALRQSEKLTAMGGLLAGVAHELNNPLAIVMGRAALLESKIEGSEGADDARRIREAAERCGRIVRTFLNMARQRPATLAPVALNDLVQAAIDLLSYTLRSCDVHLEVELAAGLPPALADGDRLGQLILNLIVNAQQALVSADVVAPRVTGVARRLRLETGLEAQRPNRAQRVWLRVSDSGPGVAAEDAERIFAPFFTTKGEGYGTGLGLAVARSVAREHGGDLILEAVSPLGGASFRLSVPLAGVPAPEAQDEPAGALGDEAPPTRVLVVDDEAEISDLMRESLEAAGYEVATAESGEVALELLDEARFDAIVSDLRMAGLDGTHLWQALRERHPAMASRLLFVTGDTLSLDAAAFLSETGAPSLEKPFAPRELVEAVRASIERAALPGG